MPINALDSKISKLPYIVAHTVESGFVEQVTWQYVLMTTPTRMYVIKLDDPLVYRVDDNSNKNVCHKT